ncbi:MAG: lactonase family protein [Cyclobacteriaceae bacterium]
MKLSIKNPKITLLFLAMISFSACQQNPSEIVQAGTSVEDDKTKKESYWVYVSSGGQEGSEIGIGIHEWDINTGILAAVRGVNTVATSSYLALDAEKERLYSINGDGIQAFKINRETGGLDLLNQVENAGRGGCHLSISNDHQFLLAAYYSSGSAASYALNEDGSIGEHVSVVQHQGSSVNQERQEGPHAHMILPAPVGNLVFVPDLGTDKVMAYQISDQGELSPAPIPFASLDPGYGPRHMVFHPNKQFAYVLAELTGNVVGFKFDPERGLSDKINDLSTLPSDFTDFSKSADIHITSNGKYLYASNRGHNSLAVYAIDQESGVLSLLGTPSCGGDWPRAFEIDPSGDYILVANKRSNAISVQKISSSSGLFEAAGNVKTVGAPQCIRFLKRK